MGQQQSQEHTDSHPTSSDDSDLYSIEQEIQRLRQELQELKQEGQDKKQLYGEELKSSQSHLDDSVRRLCESDRDATSVFHFWEYLEIIRREEDRKEQDKKELSSPTTVSTSSPTSTFSSSASWSSEMDSSSSPSANTTTKPSVTTLSKSSISAITTQLYIDLVRFFQAHLLRKLHMAVMLETQRKKQARGWNKLTVFLYHRAQDHQASKAPLQQANQRATETIQQTKMNQQEKQDLRSRILNLQQELLDRLQEFQQSASKTKRRSSIEDIRQSKRELEMLRYTISPTLQQSQQQVSRKVVDLTIQMVQPTLPRSLSVEEESKEDREEQPEMDQGPMRRRSSIEDIKARTRQLEETRPKLEVSPHIVPI